METIEITVAEYYDKPKFYGSMPRNMFNALEAAFIAGEATAVVSKEDYNATIKGRSNE